MGITMHWKKTFFVMAMGTVAAMGAGTVHGEEPMDASPGDRMIRAYFENETRKLAAASPADVKSLDDWTSRRELYRRQLAEMLGLDPPPDRTPLEAVVTGTVEHEDFVVEKLHFQSRPRLYVTANLYVPKKLTGPAPAILYVCGHSPAKEAGISFGNKTQYQHHAVWFARHGYVCLVLDTLQLGEIEALHHGTYREKMWWWNSRGYTPAGVEAWNAIRGLDYLQSRPEVDADRIGMTGRSGGGATTWWVAALDERVKVAVPVAGITNLKNHVVDGCVEGHCDCMYVVNTYRWDYAQIAALVAPRPLLFSNTDHDTIFPLDGVLDIYHHLRRLYDLYGEADHLGLHIAAGPHADTQPLQLHAFQWFNHFLKGDDAPITDAAESIFELQQLKVFDELPADAVNARVHETFIEEAATPVVPTTEAEWESLSSRWRRELREKSFAGWPAKSGGQVRGLQLRPAFDAQAGDVRLAAFDFDSQREITLRLYVLRPAAMPVSELESAVLHALDESGWKDFVAAMRVDFSQQFKTDRNAEPNTEGYEELKRKMATDRSAIAFVAPRGIGPTAWEPDKGTHIRRRFMLLGQTLDGMRVWDVRRAIQAVQAVEGLSDTPLRLVADGQVSAVALYAALFERRVTSLDLRDLPHAHQQGPDFLNVLKTLDVPQTVAMVAENTTVQITQEGTGGWDYPTAVADKLGWENRIRIRIGSE
jgi:dienelactone hydrolase